MAANFTFGDGANIGGDVTAGDKLSDNAQKVTVHGATNTEWLTGVVKTVDRAVQDGTIQPEFQPAIEEDIKDYAEEIEKGDEANPDKVGGVLGRLVDRIPLDTFHVVSAALPLGPFSSLVEVTKKMQSRREAEKLEARLKQLETMIQAKGTA